MQFKKGKEIKKRENTDGYYIAHLSKNGREKSISFHKLVAKHFVPNPKNLLEVNHIDFNRKNNVYTNLEWTTHIDNIRYSINAKRHVCTKNLNGKNNPNYGNHILHKLYSQNPNLAKEKLSRPGSKNGKSRKIIMIDKDGNKRHFSYIGECCEYLRNNNYTKSSINSIRARISKKIKNKTSYCGFVFEDDTK